jgi:hypothetical protein
MNYQASGRGHEPERGPTRHSNSPARVAAMRTKDRLMSDKRASGNGDTDTRPGAAGETNGGGHFDERRRQGQGHRDAAIDARLCHRRRCGTETLDIRLSALHGAAGAERSRRTGERIVGTAPRERQSGPAACVGRLALAFPGPARPREISGAATQALPSRRDSYNLAVRSL